MLLRLAKLLLAGSLMVVSSCGPLEAVQTVASVPQKMSVSQESPNQQFEVVVDPRTRSIQVNPVGFHTNAANIWVAAFNSQWNAPVFSFDMYVWNYGTADLNNVQGVVLSTTPAAPTVNVQGHNGTTADGKPYYDYGTITGYNPPPFDPLAPPPPPPTNYAFKNWQFSNPAAVPFRFGFDIRTGAASAGAQKNKPPVVSSLAAANPSISVNAMTTLTAAASDPDGDPLQYTWSAPAGGTVSGSGSTATYTAPASPGVYPVQVVVNDGKGGTDQRTCPVSVGAGGGGDGTVQGNLSFGPQPPLSAEEPAQIDINFLNGGPNVNPGEQRWIKAVAWNAAHTRQVPTTFTWSQTGSTADNYMGTLHQVTGNAFITWLTRYGSTRAGSPLVTVRAANGVSRSFYLQIPEMAPIAEYFFHNGTNYRTEETNISVNCAQANTFYVWFEDGNGNIWDQAPTVSFSSVVSKTVTVDGPNEFLMKRVTVSVPAGGFPASGSYTLTVSQSDGQSTGSHTFTISVS